MYGDNEIISPMLGNENGMPLYTTDNIIKKSLKQVRRTNIETDITTSSVSRHFNYIQTPLYFTNPLCACVEGNKHKIYLIHDNRNDESL